MRWAVSSAAARVGKRRGQVPSPGTAPAEQPPQQHQGQGGGPGGQAVVVGIGHGPGLVGGVGGQPGQGGQDGQGGQGAHLHHQRLPAPGGEGELHLALVRCLRGGVGAGPPHFLPVQIGGHRQPGGLEDEIGALHPLRRQGQGEAVGLPLPQVGGQAGGVKGGLLPGRGHHRPGLPGGIGEGRRRLGEPQKEQQGPGAHRQKGQDHTDSPQSFHGKAPFPISSTVPENAAGSKAEGGNFP